MNKIDFSSIFGKSAKMRNSFDNKLTVFFDKDIFYIKPGPDPDPYPGYHKLINGLTYICRLDTDGYIRDILSTSNNGLIEEERPLEGGKELLGNGKSTRKGGSNAEDLGERLRRFFRINKSNGEQLTKDGDALIIHTPDEEPGIYTTTSPIFFISKEDGYMIDRAYAEYDYYEDEIEWAENLWALVDSCSMKDNICGVYSPIFDVLLGDFIDSTNNITTVMPIIIDNPDQMSKSDINYADKILSITPKDWKILPPMFDEEFTAEYMQLLKDSGIILNENSDYYLVKLLSIELCSWGADDYVYSVYLEVQAEHPEWSDDQWNEETVRRVTIAALKENVVDRVLNLFKDSKIVLRLTDFTFDDEYMNVLSFKDYYKKRKAVQCPIPVYDEFGYEKIYSLPISFIYVNGFGEYEDPENGTNIIYPKWFDNWSTYEPYVSSTMTLKDYKDYVLYLIGQSNTSNLKAIKKRDDKKGNKKRATDEDYEYIETHTWEEGYNYWLNKYGIHEDSSIVIFNCHDPFQSDSSSNCLIVDLYNPDIKMNSPAELWSAFAEWCEDYYGWTAEYMDEWYDHIFGNDSDEPDGRGIKKSLKKSNDDSDDYFHPTDEQLKALISQAREMKSTVMNNVYEFSNNVKLVSLGDDNWLMVPINFWVYEYLYNKYQVIDIIEDEHALLDSPVIQGSAGSGLIRYDSQYGDVPEDKEVTTDPWGGYEIKAEDIPELTAPNADFTGWYFNDMKLKVGDYIYIDDYNGYSTLYAQWLEK